MSPETPSVEPNWFEQAFGDYYEIVYAHRTVEAAAREAAFVAKVLHLTFTDVVLDLCCGTGRHIIHLAKLARLVIGLDYSPPLLNRAQDALGSQSRLVRADMRAIPFVNAFDVVTNFFTSFGYFFAPEDDAVVASCIAGALRRGGRFFIDYANAPHVEATLEPLTVRFNGPYEIREKRWIDTENRRVDKSTVVLKAGKTLQQWQESFRLYREDELKELLAQAGLAVDTVFGDYSGAPLDAAQPRMLFVGHKE